MNRSQFNKSVVPGLFALMESSYSELAKKATYKKICTVKTSNKAYEENAYFGGLGLPAKKQEGRPITYDDFVQGPTKRWTHTTYGLGCTITEEMIEDCLYGDVPTNMSDMTREIGKSFAELYEILVFNLINNGTSTTYNTAGDGLAVFSASHTALRGGTWSNLLSPASDLSATSLQAAIQSFTTQKNDSGRYQVIIPKYIIVHPNNAWKAWELLESKYDPETANNAVNTLMHFPLQPIVSPYYTDTDAFTLVADAPNPTSGIIAFNRRAVKFANDGDFDTGDMKFKGTCRFSVEVNKPSNLYHSAGA